MLKWGVECDVGGRGGGNTASEKRHYASETVRPSVHVSYSQIYIVFQPNLPFGTKCSVDSYRYNTISRPAPNADLIRIYSHVFGEFFRDGQYLM